MLRDYGILCADVAQQLLAEAVIWRQLKHPNVLTFLGIVQDRDTPFTVPHTVTPWMTHGTLLNFIKSSLYDASNERTQLVCSDANLEDLMRVSFQLLEIAQALEYLHSLLIVHGDVKFVGSFRV
jgi:serine/threonine protein kinase